MPYKPVVIVLPFGAKAVTPQPDIEIPEPIKMALAHVKPSIFTSEPAPLPSARTYPTTQQS